MSLTVLLATVATQVGSAWFNSCRNKAHGQKMAELQRAYEEKATLEGIENARAEFAKICAFQRELEEQSQADRLELIRSNHLQLLEDDAYANALAKWPLLVPPYVMANAPLTVGPAVDQCIPLNCVLTTSSDLAFNNNVFRKLEERVALFCSMYWNVSSNKSVRFFQEAWRDQSKNLGVQHKNMYALLNNVPTLLISPVLKNGGLLFRYYWWGLSEENEDANVDYIHELNMGLSIPVTTKMKYDDETITLIVNECAPKLEAFISFFADMYYWNFYKEPPSLISLMSSGAIALPSSESEEYIKQYEEEVIEYIKDTKLSGRDNQLILDTTKSLSALNKPDVVNHILSTLVENKDFLYTSDLPLIKGLSECESKYNKTLSRIASSLKKKEAITVHPFSNTDEMFYNARCLFDFPSKKNKLCHIKFIDEYAFICSITDEAGNNLYSNTSSRFHIFITSESLPLSKYESGLLNLDNKMFNKVDVAKSPCNQLSYDSDAINRLIVKVRDFLSKSRDIYNQISSDLEEYDSTETAQTITYSEIRSWVKDNRDSENELRLLLSYDEQNNRYVVVGMFVYDYGVIKDDKTYLSSFLYIDKSIKDLFNYSCVIKLNIN